MRFFLEQLADYHLQKYLTDISEFCFVFPSRRAGVFFRQYLNDKTPQPIFSPDILTINDFFGKLEQRPVSDSISLIFKLYDSYRQIMDKDISLDDFIPWGEMCLADFDDIDKYLADPEQLYRNLADQKALDDDFSHLNKEQVEAIRTFWSSFDPEKLSRLQKSFLEVWQKMPQLYHHFNERLDKDNEAYEGKMFRLVANHIQEKTLEEIPYKQVVFAGLNALNSCEKRLLNYLKIKGTATFFWDYPHGILNAPVQASEQGLIRGEHEAARFIKSNILDFPMPEDWDDPQSNGPEKITIATAANDLGQAQIGAEFLKNITTKSAEPSPEDGIPHARTALVLADENLMLPAIHAIPETWDKINVTLGYPIKNTPAYGLVEALMTLQQSMRTTKQGKTWFYHRHLLAVLRHQYIATLLGDSGRKLINDLIAGNQVFIEKSRIPQNGLTDRLLTKTESSEELTNYLKEMLQAIYRQLKENPDTSLEREFIYHLYLSIKRLGEILGGQTEKVSPDTWHRLFKKLADFQTVPFRGEPLSGLQVMGILETRVLDFDNLIVLSMNEGIFPHAAPPNSFIPYNLRKGFGLPTIDNQDSIFAYYFYRLIHRAKNVTLVWSSTDASGQTGEMSRFLHQLYYEYPGIVQKDTYIQTVGTKMAPVIFSEKNEEVMQQLGGYLDKGSRFLSPSALSTYIECPLRFYYRYLAGAKEPENISEELDPRIFGNLFHQTVEALYQPYKGALVTPEIIDQIARPEKIAKTLETIFADNVPFIRQNQSVFIDLQGKNSLVFEVLMRYLTGFFKNEKQNAPFTIRGLEKNMNMTCITPSGKKVSIGGNIDRLDEKDGMIRVIDYKTGQGENRISEIEDLFDTTKHSKIKATFQTLLYSLMVEKEGTPAEQIQPGVVWMRKLFTDTDTSLYLQPSRKGKIPLTLSLVKEEYQDGLGQLLDELFDDKIPFRQTEHEKNCEYCVYREICLK